MYLIEMLQSVDTNIDERVYVTLQLLICPQMYHTKCGSVRILLLI